MSGTVELAENSSKTKPLRLVFGASGYIGSHLVPYLRARGIPVRAASRRIEVLQARQWEGVITCAADALEPASLAAALADVDTAYYLVHSMAAGKDFGQIDPASDGKTRITATAYWHPAGFLGLAYWLSMEPAHRLIFSGLASEISNRAERLQASQ